MGDLEYFDFSDLPFLFSLALLQVYTGIKHTQAGGHTDGNIQTSNRFKGCSSVSASLSSLTIISACYFQMHAVF